MKVDNDIYAYDVEVVFKKYYGALCYYASTYICEEVMVQDLVQDVFVRLLEVPQRFSSIVHLRNFLYLSVKNACLNNLEKSAVQERHKQLIRKYIPVHDFPDEEILTAEVFRRLKEAIDELPEECRKIVCLSYFDGWDNEKIATHLQISVNTVRAQKMRGKKLLKEKLKNLFPLFLLFIKMV